MSVWAAVLLAGAASYLFRVLPILLGARIELSERTQRTLRHAGIGGVAAILASSVVGVGRANGSPMLVAAIAAVLGAAVLALGNRSMTVVLVGGGAVFAAGAAVVAAFG